MYVPAISVAAPEPIKDRFIGDSVNISIKKNATNNSKISEMEMMNFFITKLRFVGLKLDKFSDREETSGRKMTDLVMDGPGKGKCRSNGITSLAWRTRQNQYFLCHISYLS